MERKYMSMDNLSFILKEIHNVSELFDYDRFSDYDNDGVDIILSSAKAIADQEFYPYFKEMDEQPAVFKDGEVHCHKQVGKVMQISGENGWIGATFNYENGGMQMPHILHCALNHILEAANNSLTGYSGLTGGAANLICTFGSADLQELYVPKMLSGDWGGTMALTEPQAGSSLSDIRTTAYPENDGSYKVKGQKIFISGGDHQFCDNFIHLTLARIEGAPAGTKGISLFVIPKNRIESNGNLEPNDVITAGEFEKMGQRGYVTTHLVYGENDDCKGWLVGQPHKGLSYMFQMMNGARIDVGLTAASTATAAYYASLQYAKERPQGRKLSSDGTKDAKQEQTLIINHPDVRRMLLLQKSICEGSLSLLLLCAKYYDLSLVHEGEEKIKNKLLLELLTPIAKTYPSEEGLTSISNGVQVLGGYGYTMDFSLQQYYRDIRIMSLYEGTTGIQSLDLLGRKMTMENGKAAMLLAAEIKKTIEDSKGQNELSKYAQELEMYLTKFNEVMNFLLPFAMKGDYERFLSDATIFMQMTSRLVIGWQWLSMANQAKQSLIMGSKEFSIDFYEAKIHTMKFYYKYEMPQIKSSAETICASDVLTIASEKELIN
jgi:butyryl-CoA dehydrogenase